MFAFANGGVPNMGIMGEKNGGSPEAIIPLTRTSNGDLGIKQVNTNSNNGVVKVEVINQTSDEVQVTNTQTRQSLEGTILSVWINAVNTNKMGVRTMLGK
jgi:phage-related minor tail protein